MQRPSSTIPFDLKLQEEILLELRYQNTLATKALAGRAVMPTFESMQPLVKINIECDILKLSGMLSREKCKTLSDRVYAWSVAHGTRLPGVSENLLTYPEYAHNPILEDRRDRKERAMKEAAEEKAKMEANSSQWKRQEKNKRETPGRRNRRESSQSPDRRR